MKQVSEPGSLVSDPRTGGKPPSFERFFRDGHVRLLRALYLVTGSREEAEELMQEAFLKVWERWDRVSVMEDPTGYLYRTAMNAFRSRYRRVAAATRRTFSREPRDEFAAVDARDEVTRALAALTRRQRAALVVTELLGYGTEEAARILGVKPVTVRVLASQGRAALRELLEPER